MLRGSVYAQPVALGGLTVTPAVLTLRLEAGLSQVNAQLVLVNRYSSPVTVSFLAVEGEGQSLVAKRPQGYGDIISKALKIQRTSYTLGPGESMTQIITLQDDARLIPGYSSAMLKIAQEVDKSHGAVSIRSEMQVPISILKMTGAVSSIGLEGVQQPCITLNLAHTAGVVFKNTGNTMVMPRGRVVVKDHTGAEIAEGIINTDSLAIVPGESLESKTKVRLLKNWLLPGRYTSEVTYRTEGVETLETFRATLWYVAWWHIVVVLLAAIGTGLVFRYRRQAKRRLIKSVSRTQKTAYRKQPLVGRDIL